MNRILAWGTSLFVLVLILELGLRLLGFGPPVKVTEPDAKRGWRNVASQELRRQSAEFDVRFRFNSLGLRDDEIGARASGERRVLVLGDSFVLGYTVAREDHFVDLLEARLNAGAPSSTRYQVVNAGVEGYSTDQELLFLEELAGEKQLVDGKLGDVVVLCMYQNDVWWNAQPAYGGGKKPLLALRGEPPVADLASAGTLDNSGIASWWRRTAIGSRFTPAMEIPMVGIGDAEVYAEWSVLAAEPPAETRAALDQTTAILRAFKARCEARGLRFLVALIPDKVQVNAQARESLRSQLPAAAQWDLQRPTKALAACCRAAGIDGASLLDPLHPAAGESPRFVEEGTPLHFAQDWHFSPEGSRRFAAALAERLCSPAYYGDVERTKALAADPPLAAAPPSAPLWPWILGGLWMLISFGYARSYRDEPAWQAPLKVGALLAFIACVFWGVGALAGALPYAVASRLPVIVVGLILLVVLWSARKRLSTVFELMGAMADRGHWYMVPLLVVLLAIGTLLVAAASNPFVAPFIYTLF
jgi:lysophospholipase L1-like esterase